MSPIVEVKQGKLKGKENTSVLSGKKFCTFSGIPYGKPPLGDLRFRPPEPAERWVGIFDATYEKSFCIQKNEFLGGDVNGSEDCLYLNINTPEDPSAVKAPKAVMVFIHGGGYFCGSGSEIFHSADYLVEQDVIVVTLNYRLHALEKSLMQCTLPHRVVCVGKVSFGSAINTSDRSRYVASFRENKTPFCELLDVLLALSEI